MEALRLSHLFQEVTQWACIVYKTEEGYNMFLDGIKELGKKVAQIKSSKVAQIKLSKVDDGEAQVNSSIDSPP
ncbi:hypothetical protein FRX31_029218 [Thalictrum thalictroides]|uniref:Uncharacterized protein n=1 Tax=Thalictrum thalictroides TaxID=46969 RepID=A0A7J6VAJ7_THATH|nr:hypothetical protein FRX31_029218 [Thalictrum thalictroides]